jgi:hypothetical protein
MFALLLGQNNYMEELKQDAVAITDGKMILEDYGLIQGTSDDGSVFSYQVKYRSEAPANGFISRDNFVLASSMIYLPIFLALGGDFKDLAEPIGTPDIEVNIIMNKTGLQIEAKNNLQNIANRHTMTWAEMAGE